LLDFRTEGLMEIEKAEDEKTEVGFKTEEDEVK
jgi:hypothetical protein